MPLDASLRSARSLAALDAHCRAANYCTVHSSGRTASEAALIGARGSAHRTARSHVRIPHAGAAGGHEFCLWCGIRTAQDRLDCRCGRLSLRHFSRNGQVRDHEALGRQHHRRPPPATASTQRLGIDSLSPWMVFTRKSLRSRPAVMLAPLMRDKLGERIYVRFHEHQHSHKACWRAALPRVGASAQRVWPGDGYMSLP